MEKLTLTQQRQTLAMEQRFTSFFSRFEKELTNPLLRGFFQSEDHSLLLVRLLCFPTYENIVVLNEAFRRFYMEKQVTGYLSKLIHHQARDYTSKYKKDKEACSTTLDQPLKADATSTFLDLVCSEEDECIDILLNTMTTLQQHVSRPALYEALNNLTHRQQVILNLYFLKDFTHREIGDYLGISQQSVSKTYQKALSHLREAI
ncbi:sigma-70 family RNA polymerase sigma factor [Bacillus sp. RAR_GA_16]|uniref:sigma-70 family RNA polymerase sigma factor n=1 Tax=Bacillus sp. RAR_GA_16 TaxID=2876774 RepID=UPI001CCC2525|nr:sigma-70 family RNA polymerase sigma factor [Bacillus sp. RAR_GA_16]MCA0174574.1 sigma-70 family RNA polymerase sigma factor [Bacillus sp. RAR_GA_16]